jgi:hypothetical protein
MLLLIAATLIAMVCVIAAWGSEIDAQARFRIEPLRSVGVRTRSTNSAA